MCDNNSIPVILYAVNLLRLHIEYYVSCLCPSVTTMLSLRALQKSRGRTPAEQFLGEVQGVFAVKNIFIILESIQWGSVQRSSIGVKCLETFYCGGMFREVLLWWSVQRSSIVVECVEKFYCGRVFREVLLRWSVQRSSIVWSVQKSSIEVECVENLQKEILYFALIEEVFRKHCITVFCVEAVKL